jgi:flagellar biosynthesis/type III secretory pathway protein FliH
MKEYEQKICNIIDNLKAEMRYQCDKVNEQAYKQGHKRGYAEGYELGK